MKTMIYSAIALILSASALTACSSDDGVTGDPARDWAGTTTAFTPTDDQGFGTYYMPAIGRVGDPMPFYDQKAGDFKEGWRLQGALPAGVRQQYESPLPSHLGRLYQGRR